MKLNEIYQLNQQLSDCLNKINEQLEKKEIMHFKIVYWSSHEDLFNNLGNAILAIPVIDSMIALNEDKIKLIINQLNKEIQ